MKTNRLLGVALCVASAFAHAQLTTVTASAIRIGGSPISTGSVVFVPVNSQGQPIFVARGGGGLDLSKTGQSNVGFPCALTSGAISGSCQVPDSALTTPANILYNITITDTSTGNPTSGLSFTLQMVPNVTGTTWALDDYAPPAVTTPPTGFQSTAGASLPGSCNTATLYTRTGVAPGLYYCPNGTPIAVGVSAPYAGATMFAYGDSHCSGQGVTVAQSYTTQIASARNWGLVNDCVGGYQFQDEVATFNFTTRVISANSVTLQNMGSNNVTDYSQLEGNATGPNAADAADFVAGFRAWQVLNGTVSSNVSWAVNAPTTGTWELVDSILTYAPPPSKMATTAAATMTFTVTGTRVDLITMTYPGNTSTYTWTIDGVAQNCVTATTTCGVASQLNTDGVSALSPADFATRGLSNATHTVVITNGGASPSGGAIVIGVVGTDTTVPATLRPLVISTYVARFGTLDANYANHTDALVAAFQALQATEFATLQADGFNIVPVNFTAPVSDATAWWNPNDATQTQSDWQHPNWLGQQHVAKAIANALTAAGR